RRSVLPSFSDTPIGGPRQTRKRATVPMRASIDPAKTFWKNSRMSRNETKPSTLTNLVRSVIATVELPALGPEARPNVKAPGQLQRELDLIFSKTSESQAAK